jgi:hypothetical protein
MRSILSSKFWREISLLHIWGQNSYWRASESTYAISTKGLHLHNADGYATRKH